MRKIVGVLLATAAVYAWGFLYWGVSAMPQSAWKQTDAAVVGPVLLEHFPEVGTYYVPWVPDDMEKFQKLHEAGPLVMVHMLSRDGQPMMDTKLMQQGFVLVLVTMSLIALILTVANLPSYGERLFLVSLTGFTEAFMIDIGEVVWWRISAEWQLSKAAYDLTAWVLGGAILAAMVKPRGA